VSIVHNPSWFVLGVGSSGPPAPVLHEAPSAMMG
jgi:hypothetical protein